MRLPRRVVRTEAHPLGLTGYGLIPLLPLGDRLLVQRVERLDAFLGLAEDAESFRLLRRGGVHLFDWGLSIRIKTRARSFQLQGGSS